MEGVKEFFGIAAVVMEIAGVATILVGFVVAIALNINRWRASPESAYDGLRRRMGRAIILGLEFLIAGDIIRTVAVSHTLDSVAVLAVIVLIRAFLSFTLEAEIEKRWPWQRPPASGA